MREPRNPQPATSPKRTRSQMGQSASGTKKHQSTAPTRPISDDREGWKVYWATQGQPWRMEPEPDAERQNFLAEQRATELDTAHNIYPFKAISLSRGDVEWLVDVHQGEGRLHKGVDLRGADLRGVDLSRMPLSKADLSQAHLDGAILIEAHLERACFREACLQGAALFEAHLERADFYRAVLRSAYFIQAHLEGSNLQEAHLEKADLNQAHLEEADLSWAHLEDAKLIAAHLEGTSFYQAHLEGTTLSVATMDAKTRLMEAMIDTRIEVADVVWNNAPLMRLDWEQVPLLGDEYQARQSREKDGKKKGKSSQLWGYQTAVRANLQLALTLRGQGLNERADHFFYRAQLCQRVVFRLQRHWLKYGFSWFLAILTGYGYRMWRIVVAYILLILVFALSYWSFGIHSPHDVSFWTAIIVSVTAFHGRVFSNPFTPDVPDVQVIITAIEAVCGLIVEALFVAMLVQKFFNR